MHDDSLILQTVVVALVVGAVIQVFARHIRFPPIAFLLVAGVLVGPEALGLVVPESLGSVFTPVISLAVAIVLFEGGLTLDRDGFRTAGTLIRRLVTVGALVTWFATAAAAWALLDVGWDVALLMGSLVIVTGPTVVTPLLRRIRVTRNVHQILHWEGVLIDPIGVFIAVLAYEWVVVTNTGIVGALGGFFARIGLGVVVGLVGGALLGLALRKKVIPHDLVNVVTLTVVLLLFAVSEIALYHTGILTVVVAGLTLGWIKPPQLRGLTTFKTELTELVIGFLFILLASNLDIDEFARLGLMGIALVALVVGVVRPLAVLASTAAQKVPWQEKVFLSWVAPRGVVAASLASLFAMEMAGQAAAKYIEPFTFAVIFTTVLLQGSTAGWVARLLGLKRPQRTTHLIVGAQSLGRAIASALLSHGVDVIVVDIDADAVERARSEGLDAFVADALDDALPEDPRLAGVGTVLVAGGSPAFDRVVAEHWVEEIDEEHVHTWAQLCAADETSDHGMGNPDDVSHGIESGELSLELVDSGQEQAASDHHLFRMVEGRARAAGRGGASSDNVRVVVRRRGESSTTGVDAV